ncbi:MAG: signal peptidase II [Verrucomicrobiota bacterium]
MGERRYPYGFFWAIVGIILIADQWTKLWIVRDFWLGRSIEVIPNFLNWTYVRNDGVAFGMFQGNNVLMGCLVVLILGLAVWWARSLCWEMKGVNIIAGMVAGGAIGNLIDRFRHGYVVDFVDVNLGFMRWPTFNVADSAISISMVLILLFIWKGVSFVRS